MSFVIYDKHLIQPEFGEFDAFLEKHKHGNLVAYKKEETGADRCEPGDDSGYGWPVYHCQAAINVPNDEASK